MSNPLRYNISSWLQLPECRSNNSTDLYITVKQIIDDGSHRLQGINIQVNHSQYGTLFACLVDSSGTLLTPDPISGIIQEFNIKPALPEPEEIDQNKIYLEDILATFGFDITFHINQHLSGDQLAFLMSVNELGYDKLRRLYVQDKPDGTYSEYIIVFNVAKCPAEWLNVNYMCGKKPFVDALLSSGAMNLTDLYWGSVPIKSFDWTWLTYVANIVDIFEDNGYSEE